LGIASIANGTQQKFTRLEAITLTPPAFKPGLLEAPVESSVWSCKAAGCTVQVIGNAHLIDPEVWKQVFSGQCKDYRYYEVVEETLYSQFDQKYFVIKNETTGATAVQPFFFVNQDLLAGLPFRLRRALSVIRRTWPRFLELRILMVGCAAGEGQLDSVEPWTTDALHEAVQHYARHRGVAMILLKDFPSKYRVSLGAFSNNGYIRVPSMPGARLAIDFTNFDDYMRARLGRIFRKNLRRKFKHAGRFPALTMEVVNDITPFVDEVYPLYLQTFHRSEFKFEKLTREYLCAMGRRIPDRARFFIWRQESRIVAFALCMVHEDALCDMNVGMDYSVALDLHLYFVTFRDIVQWAASNGLKTYYSGPLNYDPKLHLRLDLEPLDLYVCHTSPLINPVLHIALKYLQPARHDPKLRQFRNAGELY
jgi:hypothetical protein